MSWSETRESNSGNITVSPQSGFAIQLAASETRIYAVVRTGNRARDLELQEVSPDTRTRRRIGSLFVGTYITAQYCAGLEWDSTIGALRALIKNGSTQTIYQVSIVSGQASAPLTLSSSVVQLVGLFTVGSNLLSQSASGTNLYIINTTTGSVTQSTRPSASLVPGSSVKGIATSRDGDTLFTRQNPNIGQNAFGGRFANGFTISANISPRPSGMNGVAFFGSNIYSSIITGNTATIGFQRDRRMVVQNRVILNLGRNFSTWRVIKRDNGHVYLMQLLGTGFNLYQLNYDPATAPTLTFIGQMRSGLGTVHTGVWNDTDTNILTLADRVIWGTSVADGGVDSGTGHIPAGNTFEPIGGYENDALRLTVWNSSGEIRHLLKTGSGGYTSTGLRLIGSPGGAFFDNNAFWQLGSLGDIYRRGTGARDRNNLVLDTQYQDRIGTVIEQGLFHINGTMYIIGQTYSSSSDTYFLRLFKLRGLFPELYRQGTVIDPLALGNPAHITRTRAQSAEVHTLPRAYGGTTPYTYSLQHQSGGSLSNTLPTGMSFSPSTRGLTLTSAISTGTYTLIYKVVDNENPQASVVQAFSVTVGRPSTPPTTGSLRMSGQSIQRLVGAVFTQELNSAQGGTAPYTYDLGQTINNSFSTTLPHGIDFDSITNTIEVNSGVAAGVYTLTHRVTDSASPAVTVDATVTLTIAHALTLPTISNIDIDNDEDFNRQFPTASGGTGTVTYSLTQQRGGALPSGVSFTASTRTMRVAGSSSSPGTYNLRYTARTSTSTVNQDFTLVVQSASRVTLANASFNMNEGQATQTFTLPAASGGNGSYTYSLVWRDTRIAVPRTSLSGQITFNPTTRVLRVPQGFADADSAPYNFTYTATDTSTKRRTASSTVTVTVGEDLTLSNPGTVRYTKGGRGTTITLPGANGGTGGYTYTLTGLVAGMTFAANTQRLTIADATAAGDVSLTYRVRDGAGDSATQTFTVSVVNALTLGDPTDIEYTKGNNGTTATLPIAQGGSGGYVYSVSGLVSGITFNANTRVLTIADSTTVGTRTLTYMVRDSRNNQASQTFSVVINAEVIIVPELTLPQVGNIAWSKHRTDFTQTLPEATGGTAPRTYALTGLPSGATFNAGTRVLTVTRATAEGTYSLTYTVTDSTTPNANTASRSFSLQVQPTQVSTLALPKPDNINTIQQTGIVRQVLEAATGGYAPYTYSMTFSPAASNLSFQASTRTVVVDQLTLPVGDYTATYTARDDDGVSVSQTFTITSFAAPDLYLPVVRDRAVDAGKTASFILPPAQGGRGTYTYSVTGLSAGVNFVPSTRTLFVSDAAAAGELTLTYRATDVDNAVTRTFKLAIVNELTLPAVDTINYNTDLLLSETTLPEATGGTTPYTYEVDNIPPGAAFDPSTRELELTSRIQPGRYALVYRVTDSTNPVRTASQPFVLEATQAPISLPEVDQIIISDTTTVHDVTFPEAIRGVSPITYEFTNIPAGISRVGNTRALRVASGVAPGTYTILYSATDSVGNMSQRSITVVREPHTPPPIAPSRLTLEQTPDRTVLQDSTLILPAPSGGTPPYHYFVEEAGEGKLPDGLSFEQADRRLVIGPDARARTYVIKYEVFGSGRRAQDREDEFLLHVREAPQIRHQDFVINLYGASHTITLPEATGGGGNFVYNASIDGADLPPFLTLNGRRLEVAAHAESQTIDLDWDAVDADNNQIRSTQTLHIRNAAAEQGTVVDPGIYPTEGRMRFDLDHTAGEPLHYVPAGKPWQIQLPTVEGGQGEIKIEAVHPFSRDGLRLWSDGVPVGDYPVLITARDENLATVQIRYLVRAVDAASILEEQQLRDLENNDTFDISNKPLYDQELQAVVAAYTSEGREIFYANHEKDDGVVFLGPSGNTATLSDEVRDKLIELNVDDPGSYALVYFITAIEPMSPEPTFPDRNVPTADLSAELQRLDLQDQSAQVGRGASNQINFGKHYTDGTIAPSKFSEIPVLGTEYLEPEGVKSTGLAEQAVTKEKLDPALEPYFVESYSVYDLTVVNEVPAGTLVGVRYTEKGYEAYPDAENPVGRMRTPNRVARVNVDLGEDK